MKEYKSYLVIHADDVKCMDANEVDETMSRNEGGYYADFNLVAIDHKGRLYKATKITRETVWELLE